MFGKTVVQKALFKKINFFFALNEYVFDVFKSF